MAFELGTIPRWSFTDGFGRWNAGGKLHFYRDVAKDQEKTVYQDQSGIIPYPNPITLDGDGGVGLIYFNDDEPYYITLYDSTDTQLIWDVSSYAPAGGGGGGGSTEIDYTNFVINGQFRFFNDQSITTVLASETEVAPYWYFDKSNVTAVDSLSFIEFAVGTTTPPFSPTNYLRYGCTNVPTGETYKDIYIKIKDVNAFQDQQITISVEQQGTIPSQLIEFRYLQHFGTGGTPSSDVVGAIASHNITVSWTKLSSTTTLPTIGGKTIGTNKDDYLAIIIRLPLNAVSQFDMTNLQINLGASILDYEFQTYDKANIERRVIQMPYTGYINGLYTTWAADNITISSGSCADKDNNDLFVSNGIQKYIDATWANGTGNGGLASGLTVTADTWYHVFLLFRPSGGYDAGFDSDLDATNLLADAAVIAQGYIYYRRVWSIRTEVATTDLREYVQQYDYCKFLDDFNNSYHDSVSSVVSFTGTYSVDVPSGLSFIGKFNEYSESSNIGHVILVDNIGSTLPTEDGTGISSSGGETRFTTAGPIYLRKDSNYIEVVVGITQSITFSMLSTDGGAIMKTSLVTLGYKDYRLD